MTRKLKNKTIPRGVMIRRESVWVRVFHDRQEILERIGPVNSINIDRAKERVDRLKSDIKNGRLGLDHKVRPLRMDHAVEIFWNLHASKKDAARAFRYQLDHLKAFFSQRFIHTISDIDVINYRGWRGKQLWRGHPIKSSTINREQTVLTTFFNKLRLWKKKQIIDNYLLPDDNPTLGIRKADERPFARTRIVTPEEFKKFLEVAPESVRRICLAAVNTTLRWKTLAALSKRNVYSADQSLGGTQSKVKKLYRVPVNGVIQKLIDTAPSEELFDFTNFRKLFEDAVTKSGVPWFQFRDLRRTGARMMLQKGIDIATVSRYLGHSDIRTTQIYVSPSQNDLAVAGEILGSMYNHDPAPNCGQNCGQEIDKVTEEVLQKPSVPA